MANETNVPSEWAIRLGLEDLAQLRAQAELLRLDYQAKRERILDTVRQDLQDLDAEYDEPTRIVAEKIASQEDMLKKATLMRGETVAGEQLQVVYSKPKTTWDSAGLNGYAVAHPEILAFRKQGDQPSVSIQARRTK